MPYQGLPEGAELVNDSPSYAGLPKGAEIVPESSILSETLKAPARVVGGIAQEAGEAAQYVTGDRVGGGIRKWGEGVQQRNAQTDSFREAHPVLSVAGDVAEGAAKMAPYLAADLVMPEVAFPATASRIAKGVRMLKSAPFSTGVLPAVMGASQGQRSYEKGVANGLSPDEALSASYAPAAVTGVGMAGMGVASHAIQEVGGAAKTLKGQFAKHAAADTGIMMAQGVATSEAEKATGIDPEAKPLDQLKDPKAWLQAALTGGMFAGLGVAKKGMVAKALKAHLDSLEEAAPEERAASVEALASAVHPEDPAAHAAFQAEALDKLQAGEPILSEDLVNRLTAEPKVEETREAVLQGLKDSIESGGEVDPLEAHNASEEAKVVEALKTELPAPAEQGPYVDPIQLRAEAWAKEGRTISKLTGMPDAEVAARLDEMGFTIREGEAIKTGGKHVKEWLVETKTEEPEAPAPQEAKPEGPAPISDREQRLAYEDNPNLVVARKDGKIALIDQKAGEVVGMAHLDGEKLGEWVDGKEPATPAERVQAEAVFRRHLGEDARLNRVDLIFASIPKSVVGSIRSVIKQHGPSFLKMSDSITDKELHSVPERVWNALPGLKDSLKKEYDRQIARRDAKPQSNRRLNINTGEVHELTQDEVTEDFQRRVNRHLDVIRRQALARYIYDSVGRDIGKYTEKGWEAYNRAEGAGIPKEELETHLKDIIAKLKVPVEIVNHAGEVEGLRPEAPAFNGAFHQGKIYLNAEHITSLKEAEHVLLKHELAHAGLLGSLGREGLNEVLAKAWGDLKSGVREFAKEKGIDTRTKGGKLEATEEYLVHLAEQGTKSPLWSRFVQLFKEAMRKLGFELKYSERELRSLVLEATKSMTVGDGPTRFSRLTEAVTATPAFKKWFGESKVVDEKGEPLMVYHGTAAETFDEFNTRGRDLGSHFGTPGQAATFSSWSEAGGKTYPVYLSVKNPLRLTDKGGFEESRVNQELIDLGIITDAEAERLMVMSESDGSNYMQDKIRAAGYDGVVYLNRREGVPDLEGSGSDLDELTDAEVLKLFPEAADSWIAFDPKQIKSATGNNGDFDPKNPDIRFSRLATQVEPKDVDEATSKISAATIKRILSNTSGDVFRALMPLDKTLAMAESIPTYAPIKHQFERLQNLAHRKRAAASRDSIEAQHLSEDFNKLVKTDAATEAYNDLTHKATIYELHADPSKPLPWTEKSWKESGKERQTGKTLGQARKEVSDLWAKLTPEQREVQQRMVKHMKELKQQEIEAQLTVLKSNPLKDAIFAPAEKIAEDLHAQLWKHEQMGGPEAAAQYRAELREKHGSDVMALAEEIANIRGEGQLKGDYSPLMRYGDHEVTTHEKTEGGPGKRLKYQRFESQSDAEAEVEKIRADPTRMAVYRFDDEAARAKTVIPPAFMEKLRADLEAQGITGDAQERVMQDFMSSRVSSMPRVTLAANKLKREGVEGYDNNALRAYATYVRNASRAIANLKYGFKIEQEFRDMGNNIKAHAETGSVNDVQRMTSLQTLLQTSMSSNDVQKINNAVKTLGKSTFLWYLSSPSVWAVQWSQPFITTIPKMAARYGFGKAFTEYVKGAKNHIAGRYSDKAIDDFDRSNGFVGKRVFDLIEKHQDAPSANLEAQMKALYGKFTPYEQELLTLKVMSHQGGIDLSAAHSQDDLINSSNMLDRGLDKTIQKAGVFMRASETGSRRAAAVSAFSLALKEKGYMGANKYANHVINDTLFDFDSSNRPAWMKTNVGRVVGQFQFFRTHMLGKTMQLAKEAYGEKGWGEARKELAYMTGVSMGLAGAAGTPLAMLASNTVTDAIWGAMSFLFGDPDDHWNPKQDFENALKDAMGEEVTNTFFKGLPYLMGMDISKRVGMGGMADLIQGEVPPGASATDKANWYAAKILGPSWGLVTDGIKTVDAIGNGDYGTAAQAGSPKVLRDFMKAYGLTENGVKGSGGRTVLQAEDVSPFSVALQMVGINPADVSLAQEDARELAGLSTELKARRNLLTKRVTEATLSGDFEAREEALEAINAWGQKQPAMRISMKELASAVKRGMDLKAGKLPKQQEKLKAEMEGAP